MLVKLKTIRHSVVVERRSYFALPFCFSCRVNFQGAFCIVFLYSMVFSLSRSQNELEILLSLNV